MPAPSSRTAADHPAGPRRLAIIADDLTGAADAAGAHARAGRHSLLVLSGSAGLPHADVLTLDVGSRGLRPGAAARAVRQAVRRTAGPGTRVFKKIDSLLRGHVGVETAAALQSLGRGRPLAVVAPAFPRVGRTTLGGVVHHGGRPCTTGPFGGDIVAALADGGITAGRIDRRGLCRAELCERLVAAHSRGCGAVVMDAVDDDLEAVARAAEAVPFPTLLVGSGGLAAHALPGRGGAAPPLPVLPGAARTLFVVGSRSAAALAQSQALRRAGVHCVTAMLPARASTVPPVTAVPPAGDLLVLPPDAPQHPSSARAVAAALARTARGLADQAGALVVTGGDTARAVLDALGVRRLHILGEIEPGIVVGRPDARPRLLVVTKAGSFADAQALVRAAGSLRGGARQTDPAGEAL